MIYVAPGKPNVMIAGKPVRMIADWKRDFDTHWQLRWRDKCERLLIRQDAGHMTYVHVSNLVELLWKLRILK